MGGPSRAAEDIDDLHTFFEALAEMAKSSGRTQKRIATCGDISPASVNNVIHAAANDRVNSIVPDTVRGFVRGCGKDEKTATSWGSRCRELQDGSSDTLQTPLKTSATARYTENPLLTENMKRNRFLQYWNRRCPPETKDKIHDLTKRIAALLDEAIETGPAYTFHDSTHCFRILKKVELMLGDNLRKLTCLEASLIIVSAFCHDLGLAHQANEMRSVSSSAYGPQRNRVAASLEPIPNELFQWNDNPVLDQIIKLCQFQEDPDAFYRIARMRQTFHDADTRFCAALLRLAADFDFCVRRDPTSAYQKLGISIRISPRTSINDVEWLTRLRAGGFEIDPARDRYAVRFKASPVHPLVEYEALQILDELGREFDQSYIARSEFSDRWKHIPLPGMIDSKIVGSGYTYAELSFELARDDVLKLFAGSSLYANSRAFVRELLQNAIDAIRLRRRFGSSADPEKLDIWCWERDGYLWFRVDDTGTGMDLKIIRDYFLKVGRSYYNSEELASQVRSSSGRPFTAISRFGIGVMSCFLLGDRIEISTRAADRATGEQRALRLSLTATEDFFVLREPEQGAPMPTFEGEENYGYRSDIGTSIAVRIDASQHDVSVSELTNYARSSLFHPSCQVTINGSPAGDPHNRMGSALLDKPTSTILRRSQVGSQYPEFLGEVTLWAFPLNLTRNSGDERIEGQLAAFTGIIQKSDEHLFVIDLYAERIKQVLSAKVRNALEGIPVVVSQPTINDDVLTVSFNIEKANLSQALSPWGVTRFERVPEHDDKKDELKSREDDLRKRHPHLNGTDISVLTALSNSAGSRSTSLYPRVKETWPRIIEAREHSKSAWWGHNGIALPIKNLKSDSSVYGDEEPTVTLRGSARDHDSEFSGLMGLFDDLRPELSLSRAEIVDIPFSVLAAMHLSVRNALSVQHQADALQAAAADRVRMTNFLLDKATLPDLRTVQSVLKQSPTNKQPPTNAWRDERVFRVEDSWLTVDQIRKIAEKRPVKIEFRRGYSSRGIGPWLHGRIGVPETIARSLAQLQLETTWRDGVVITTDCSPNPREGLEFFPPLFFIAYDGDRQELVRQGSPYNASHPFSEWLVRSAPIMNARAPGYFKRILDILTKGASFDSFEWQEYIRERFEADGRILLPELFSIKDHRDKGAGVLVLSRSEDYDLDPEEFDFDVDYGEASDAERAFKTLLDEAIAKMCRAVPAVGTPPDHQ